LKGTLVESYWLGFSFVRFSRLFCLVFLRFFAFKFCIMEKLTVFSPTLFNRISKRLKVVFEEMREPVPKGFHFKDAAAITLGYKNHKECLSAAQSSKNSPKRMAVPRDEELSSEDLAARRLSQAVAFRSYCDKFGLELPAEEIIAEWRPTSARPMAETVTQDDISRLQEKGLPQDIQDLLTAIERGQIELDETHIKAVRLAIKSSNGFLKQWMPLSAGTIAARAVNSDNAQKNELGISLLELLVEIGFTACCFHLAQALNNRAGCADDKPRARRLLIKVKKALDNGEEVFVAPSELKRFYSRAGWFLLQSEKKSHKNLAVQCLKKGVELNCPRSALTLFHVYSPSIDDPIFLLPDVPKISLKAERFWEIAISNGYNPEHGSFPEGV
jgi:hypothetical protein